MAFDQNKIMKYAFDDVENVYHGKVRDVYFFKDLLATVVSDRISAFDHILPRPIPYKGQVLNQIALHFLKATSSIVPNWYLASPDPIVTIGKKCEPIRLEMVVRAYLAGHSWRTYEKGIRTLCGVSLPDGLKQNDRLPEPIITPSTKALEGHDEDISAKEILDRKIVTASDWQTLSNYSHLLFEKGSQMARDRGLILVDTKYEFGFFEGQILLIDEIHTPDSSRYFYLDGFEARQAEGLPQIQLSKEFVREWLIVNGFQGIEGQEMPHMDDKFVEEISQKYIHLYEVLTGNKFVKSSQENIEDRVVQNVNLFLKDYYSKK